MILSYQLTVCESNQITDDLHDLQLLHYFYLEMNNKLIDLNCDDFIYFIYFIANRNIVSRIVKYLHKLLEFVLIFGQKFWTFESWKFPQYCIFETIQFLSIKNNDLRVSDTDRNSIFISIHLIKFYGKFRIIHQSHYKTKFVFVKTVTVMNEINFPVVCLWRISYFFTISWNKMFVID